MSDDRARRSACGRRRRPAVPRDDRLAPVHRRSAEGVRDLAGRPRHLGRGRTRFRAARSGSRVDEVCRSVRSPMRALPRFRLAQAFGRLGNWFNQELFGKPTTVWWALKIDPAHRPPGFEQYATFHPTFLYEALWCLILCGALIFDRQAMGIAAEARQPVLALRRRLHVRALLHRAHPHRLRVAAVRTADQRVGQRRRVPRRGRDPGAS